MKEETLVFAKGLSWKKIFWIFVFGCIFGCIFEMIVTYIYHDIWVSRRGLIYGPLNPVYGVGAAIFSVFLCRYKNIFIIFVGGALLGGGIEYLLSLLQEHIFGTVSWNYSHRSFNIHGRTNLYYMIIWGILSVLYVKLAYPFLSKWIEKIPNKIGNILTGIMIILVIFDCVISLIACYRQTERNNGITANNKIEFFLDKTYPNDRLNKIYNNAKKTKSKNN